VSRRDDERIAGILDAASEIAEIIELGREAWDKDRIRRLAAERLLEIIGAAASSLSEDFRNPYQRYLCALAGKCRAPEPAQNGAGARSPGRARRSASHC
jgi:hypothetical protein